jgi:hypothetical protein
LIVYLAGGSGCRVPNLKTKETQMKPLLIAFAVVALSASTFGASQAQDSGGAPPAGGGGGVRAACAAEFAKVCPGVDRAGMRP